MKRSSFLKIRKTRQNSRVASYLGEFYIEDTYTKTILQFRLNSLSPAREVLRVAKGMKDFGEWVTVSR